MGEDSLGPRLKRGFGSQESRELESNQHRLARKSRVQGLGLDAEPAALREKQANLGNGSRARHIFARPAIWKITCLVPSKHGKGRSLYFDSPLCHKSSFVMDEQAWQSPVEGTSRGGGARR